MKRTFHYYFVGDEFRAKIGNQSYTVAIKNKDGSRAIYDSITPAKMRELKKGGNIEYIYNDRTGEFMDT